MQKLGHRAGGCLTVAVYMNDELYDRYRRGKTKVVFPIVEEKERQRVLETYGSKLITDVYTYREVVGLDWNTVAAYSGIDSMHVQDAYEGYKKVNFIGYSKEPIIYIPPWNDIVHIVDEKQLTPKEQRERILTRIERLQRSPSPEIVKNIGIILTAVDDVQDFTTTLGVGARLLEKATKMPHILSAGSFTAGELLNNLSLYNKIPFEKMSPSEILSMVKKKKIDLDLLTPAELTRIKFGLREKYPTWDDLPVTKQKEFIQANYKITKERWGIPLKDKKRAAENFYSKGTPWGKLTTEVDKRLARVLPSHGEMLEILQTSDNVAGVGISLGPIVGLITDTVFGIAKGAPLRFSKQTISEAEKKAVLEAGKYILNLPMETMQALEYQGNLLVKTAYMIGAGEDLGVDDFLTGAWAGAQSYIEIRRKELQYAITDTAEKIKNWVFSPGPKTPPIVMSALWEKGIDPKREEGFPGVKLGKQATFDEIANAYLEKIPPIVRHFEGKLSKHRKGEFLASCLHAIGLSTCCLAAKDGAAIHETFALELAIYTRAVDYGLEPPIWSTDEQFKNWHTFCMQQSEQQQLDAPTHEILTAAREKLYPLEDIL